MEGKITYLNAQTSSVELALALLTHSANHQSVIFLDTWNKSQFFPIYLFDLINCTLPASE